MADLILKRIGSNRIEILKLIRETTGVSLTGAKNIVETVESGQEYTITGIPNDKINDVMLAFRSEGADVHEIVDDYFFDMTEGKDTQNNNFLEEEATSKTDVKSIIVNKEKGETYIPPFASNIVHKLNREETMKMLMEVEKVAKESEQIEIEIASLTKEIAIEKEKGEGLRRAVSKKAKRIIWSATLIATLIGCIGTPVMGILLGVVMLIVMNMTVKKADLQEHAIENNANADAYLHEYVDPLQERLDVVIIQRDELVHGGKKQWAISIVGNDMFYSACINDLYGFIKKYRADNLKEALNLYDDTQHKARMEEMQAAIQNASEISASESVKQTALSKQIEKNTHKAATAAKATAVYTRSIDKNTR